MITYCGNVSIGASIPGATAAGVAGAAGINAALPDITSRIAALQAFTPSPVDFAEQLKLATQILASINAAISSGLTPPSIAVQIAQVEALIAELLATVVSINGQLTVVTDFLGLLTAAGVYAYTYAGTLNMFGTEFNQEFNQGLPGRIEPPSPEVEAIVLVTDIPATFDAMEQIFKVSP